jgi:predicted signal transduction protein with EAL and GGDEF domain
MPFKPLLIDDLPDLVLRLRRDGTILDFAGGSALPSLRLAKRSLGAPLEAHWPHESAMLLKQLAIRAISSRGLSETSFTHDGLHYEARAQAESPECAICMIRTAYQDALGKAPSPSNETAVGVRFDRREFWRRFTDSISAASLSGRPAALAIIHLEGLTDIAQLMDTGISDRIIGTAMRRFAADIEAKENEPLWYIGQIADNELALLIESADRNIVEEKAMQVRASLSVPITIGDASFQLTPYLGAALFGQDATTQGSLVECARVATLESRRSDASVARFFSDTMKLRALTRMDIAQELSDAIANRDIRLKYRGRYDLTTGSLRALVGYLQWTHPIRGDIRPSHFLGIAAATGLSTTLSRSLLQCLREDFSKSKSTLAPEVRISYGALRHHVLEDAFVADIAALLGDGVLDAQRLELRIAEKTYVVRNGFEWRSLVDAGVQLVVDEVGRDVSSIDRLARAPLWGLQLDRACAVAVVDDSAAASVCRAVISVAHSLGLVPIGTGIDGEVQRSALHTLGCTQGIGDLYDGPSDTTIKPERFSSRHQT